MFFVVAGGVAVMGTRVTCGGCAFCYAQRAGSGVGRFYGVICCVNDIKRAVYGFNNGV